MLRDRGVNARKCLKCESGCSRFQPGEGPSRGLLCDYEPSDGPSFEALVVIRFMLHVKQINSNGKL